MRNAVDELELKGQFILRGSTIIDDSGKGEAQMQMYPGTGYEDNVKRNPVLARLILRSPMPATCIRTCRRRRCDITVEMKTASMTAVEDYVGALERVYVIENIDAWRPAIQSATAIKSRKSAASLIRRLQSQRWEPCRTASNRICRHSVLSWDACAFGI